MNKAFRIPPDGKSKLTPAATLASRLGCLIGQAFPLSGKTRTDGSKLRKLVAATLEQDPLPAECPVDRYRIIPKKGVPKNLREYLDTYLVTSGDSYNLQVWNRNPAADSVQVEFATGEPLRAVDVRIVLTRVDVQEHVIRAIAVLSPRYIVERFGPFGKPTIKHQLIITPKARAYVLGKNPPLVFYPDHAQMKGWTARKPSLKGLSIFDPPKAGRLYSLRAIEDWVSARLLGKVIPRAGTKNRGQWLETLVARELGYKINEGDLVGGYPDIRNQLLEVKVQDAATVDLGQFSPQFEEGVPLCPEVTTVAVRYLIALTDPKSGKVVGAIVCPGDKLGLHCAYVSDTSFKCQRSIPMNFFDSFDGKVAFDPGVYGGASTPNAD